MGAPQPESKPLSPSRNLREWSAEHCSARAKNGVNVQSDALCSVKLGHRPVWIQLDLVRLKGLFVWRS